MLCKIKPVLTADQKENRTLLFAAKELQKYLRMVVSEEAPVMSCASYKAEEGTIFMGVDLKECLPKVENKEADDAICIDVENFSGVITGNNARAVLIAAYRFLREKGYKFIRPGKDGETVPETVDGKKVYVCEKASYRHRGICIEGGVFQEELCDIIDWLPKVALNEYFVQFSLPKAFFNTWYLNKNPYKQKMTLTEDEIEAMTIDAEDEISKRSIIYHKVGHGWTCQAIGLPGTVFGAIDIEPTEEQKSMMALINGKRDIHKSPLNTNLCYSRKEIRNTMTDKIAKYCEDNPHVDYLHFWLADDSNNHCECENCADTIPSDYYVMMLNDLDRKLTEKGLDTKIVFLLYRDLFWKPIEEKIINKDRFILMFAPISRSYTYSYNVDDTGKTVPYVRNKLEFPANVGDCVAYLRQWQEEFDGDSFIFEYHLVGDQFFDFPQQNQSRVIYGDISQIGNFGLNGLVSCQIQRTFVPTSLCMNVLAESLWNKEKPFEEIEENVFRTEFGEKWEVVRDYLEALTENGYAVLVRREAKVDDEAMRKFKKTLEILDAFKSEIEEGLNTELKQNWENVKFHNELYKMLTEYFMVFGTPESEEIKEKVIDFAYKNEEKFKDVFDAELFVQNFSGMRIEK